MVSAFIRVLVVSFFSFSFLNSASAQDINGKWYFDYGYYMEFTGGGGSFSGFGGEGSSYTWVVTNGTINGNTVTWKESYNEISYLVDRVGTINGNTITGSWTSSWGQSGNFVATRVTSGGGGSGNGGGSTTGKRPTSTFVFCNRTGVGLSVADCSITVGDAGAPPRTMPTGTVNLTASNGFFPAKGSCALQQTPYSPGVGSCKAEFAIPFGYPIGVPFPIDAEYPGDTTFAPSGTAHKSIEVSCVGDPENPCSGNVGFTFANWPQIYKNFFTPVLECGNVGANKKSGAILKRGLLGDVSKCVGKVTADVKLAELLAGLDFSQIQALAGSITKKDAELDPYLKAIQALDDTKYLLEMQNAVNQMEMINNLIQKIMRDQKSNDITIRSQRVSARAKKLKIFVLGTSEFSVKNNSVKQLKVRLTKPAAKLLAALKKVGKGDINASILVKGSRANNKNKFKKAYAVNFGLN